MTKRKNPEDLLPVGRPTLYRPEYVKQVYKFALLGATDREIADLFDVTESTLNLWKLEYPEFSESLKNGKAPADADVALSLRKRALGCHVTQIRETINPRTGEIIELTTTDELPPDVKAAEIILRNRRPKEWNTQKDFHISGDLFGDLLNAACGEIIDVPNIGEGDTN